MASLRVALRGLARSPLFAGVATLSLALGVGANTAMFSLLDQILLRTLPVQNPQELVYLYHPGPTQGSYSSDENDGPSFSYPMFRNLQKEQTPFVGIAGARSSFASLSYKNSASHGSVRMVSGNYFQLLGVRPAMGRTMTEEDDRDDNPRAVAVLSYYYWQNKFGLDPSLLNQTMIINGFPYTIVGVAGKGFTSERLNGPPDLYIPISSRRQIEVKWNEATNRRNYWVSLLARLKPGVSRQRGEMEINVAYRAELAIDEQLLRQPKADFLTRFRAKKILLKAGEHGRGWLTTEAHDPLQVLMGMAVLVLLIACANVANLQLARGASRAREVAVRLALGASRFQIVSQLLTESCLLAIAGGALGLLTARWTLHAVLAMLPPSAGMVGFLTEQIEPRVLVFCMAVSILTGLVFGLFPALQSSKSDVVGIIKAQAGQISSSGASNFLRKALVTVQVALSLMLLVTAGLFSRTLANLSSVDLGLRTDHRVTFELLPGLNQYSTERAAQFHRQLTERLAAIPGVRSVSAAQVPAIAGSSNSQSINVEGYTALADESSNVNLIDVDYFRTLGMPLISGREFSRADNSAGGKVVIVNEAFVRHFLPNQNPLGRRIGLGSRAKPDTEIVGVAKDAHYANVREAPPPVFFLPLEQNKAWGDIHYYLHAAIEPERTAPLIRREVAALDPNLPIRELKTMATQVSEEMFGERVIARLSGSFAGLATVLAAIGLYGVLAFNVARRTREIGIRMALGADSGHVRALVLREMLLMLAVGCVAGLGGAAATGQFTQSLLFGLKPWDGFVYASATVALCAVALAAAYIPARRATAVDPMIALRYE